MNYREARLMAPVLERAIELVVATDAKIGDAVEQALAELIGAVNAAAERRGVPAVGFRRDVPERVVNELVVAVFRIVVGGRIPGLPDA